MDYPEKPFTISIYKYCPWQRSLLQLSEVTHIVLVKDCGGDAPRKAACSFGEPDLLSYKSEGDVSLFPKLSKCFSWLTYPRLHGRVWPSTCLCLFGLGFFFCPRLGFFHCIAYILLTALTFICHLAIHEDSADANKL